MIKKTDELITITEYARLRGVTTETLRHYDRIGLLKPAYTDPDTGLRYYSLLFENDKLGTIMELKSLNMSLNEIRDFLDGRNMKKTLEILKNRQQMLKEKANEIMNIEKVLNERICNIEGYINMEYDFDEIFISEIPSRSALISDKEYYPDQEALINREAIIMENEMMDVAPLIGGERFALSIPSGYLLSGDPKFKVALIVSGLKMGKSVTTAIPEGLYVCKRRYGDSMDVMKDFEAIEDYCAENKLEIAGDAIELLVVDMSITDIPEENIYELQVPVKKKRP